MFKPLNTSLRPSNHHSGPIKYTFNPLASIINAPNQLLGKAEQDAF